MTGNFGRKDWRVTLLDSAATVGEAVRNLEGSHLQITLVVSDDELVGTITDGDIRRGLLQGIRLEDGLDGLIQTDPVVVPPDTSRIVVMRLMEERQVHGIPVVEANRRVVGLHLWSDFSGVADRSNLMVIMAGGEGRRLRPLTDTRPKPLLPVGGRPMLEHIIDQAVKAGFHRLVLSIGYLGHMIEEHFGNGDGFGVEIDYLREDKPLGTAGSLTLLDPLPVEPILVTNGDVLTDIRYDDMLDYHVRHNAQSTMAVIRHEWRHQFGVVHTDGVEFLGIEEKPVDFSTVNAGVYVLEPEVLKLLTSDERCDMTRLFQRLRERGDRTIVYPLHEPWSDIGRREDYLSAR